MHGAFAQQALDSSFLCSCPHAPAVLPAGPPCPFPPFPPIFGQLPVPLYSLGLAPHMHRRAILQINAMVGSSSPVHALAPAAGAGVALPLGWVRDALEALLDLEEGGMHLVSGHAKGAGWGGKTCGS